MRDLLLGQPIADPDYAFAGTTDDFLAAHPAARLVGKSVTVVILHGREYMPLRGGDITCDLAARDLTINALALDANHKLHCHPKALDDLHEHVLRPASPTALRDDPARVFRLARFAAEQPGWHVADEAFAQLRALPQAERTALPAERVGRELLKALAAPAPGRFLDVLATGNCLEPWFHELEKARQITAGPIPWHTGNVFAHTVDSMNKAAGDPLAVWMALCHDLGKICTDPALLPHHYGHEARGVALAEALALRLRLPALYTKAGTLAAREHQKAGNYATLRPSTRRDMLVRLAAANCVNAFLRMVDADSGQSISPKATADLALIKAVHLPEVWRDKGALSAQKLRELQCQALAKGKVGTTKVPLASPPASSK